MIPIFPARRGARALALCALLASSAACGGEERVERPPFDTDRAWSHLTSQIAFGPRFAGHRGHRLAVPWLAEQLSFRADTVVVDSFPGAPVRGNPVWHRNYLARWRPELTDRILVATHWDTPRYAERDPDPENHRRGVLGANEGASGTAVMMELAQLLNEVPPRVGVDFLFADHALDGTDAAGVRAYLSSRPGLKYRWAVWVDRVADNDLRLAADPGSLKSAPQVTERLWALAKEMGRDSVWVAARATAPAGGGAAVLASAGIPTVAVVDPEHGKGNVFWRTTRDLPVNSSRESMGHVGEVLAELIYREAPPEGSEK